MNARTLLQVLAGALFLSPVAGCQNFTSFKPPSMPSMGLSSMLPAAAPINGEESAPDQKQLPPRKAADVSFRLAEDMAANGHEADAVIHYERCRQFDPQRTGIAARLAVLYGRFGKQKEALAEFEKAIQETPKNAGLHNNLGYCHYSMGNWAEAEKCYRQALALDSQHPHAWVNLGMALGMQNRYAESFEAFTKAVNPAEAHANLGFIYFSQGQKELARREYEQALQLNPGMQKAQAVLAMMDGKAEKPKLTAAAPPQRPNNQALVPPLPPQATP